MSIQTQIDRLVQAKADLIEQIEAKGVTVPADASLDDLAALVEAISTGVELPELSNPAAESEVFLGKETINALGEKSIGTFTVQPEITAQDDLIARIKTALQGKAGGSGGGLPSGLAALDCGVYEVTATKTSTVSFPHKMGVKPDFCIWMNTKNCESNPVSYTNVTGCLLAKPAVLSASSSSIYEAFQAITGFNASKTLARTASAVTTNPMTDTNACIVATSAYKLLAGDSYFWIAGKFDTAV